MSLSPRCCPESWAGIRLLSRMRLSAAMWESFRTLWKRWPATGSPPPASPWLMRLPWCFTPPTRPPRWDGLSSCNARIREEGRHTFVWRPLLSKQGALCRSLIRVRTRRPAQAGVPSRYPQENDFCMPPFGGGDKLEITPRPCRACRTRRTAPRWRACRRAEDGPPR